MQINTLKTLCCFLAIALCCIVSISYSQQNAKTVSVLTINGAIGPAIQDYITRGLQQAQQDHDQAVILKLDTPGGLYQSTRGIISAMLASSIPVIVFVSPSGARATSAGTFILYASHIAVMAPGTHLGAATPVAIGSSDSKEKNRKKKASQQNAMSKKALSDAKAYIRSLAQLRGRNSAWAETAVIEADSLSAQEALRKKVIDIVAANIPQLLQKIDGRTIKFNNQSYTLSTINVNIKQIKPDWRVEFLSVITDPNIAYVLMLIGIYGLFFEFANPGFIVPGVIGAISLLLAMYAFQLLPINYAGLALLAAGIIFMVMEAFVTSFGVLGIGGVIAFALGSVMLFKSGLPGYGIALPLVIAITVVTAGFFFLIVNMALRARFKPVVSGREELVNSIGTIMSIEGDSARMRLRGEVWQVRSDQPLQVGEKVKVVQRDGLILIVNKVNKDGERR